MNEDLEFYINEDGIACIPLKYYNDSLEEIERLNNIIIEVREYANKYNDKIQKDILEILDKENKE